MRTHRARLLAAFAALVSAAAGQEEERPPESSTPPLRIWTATPLPDARTVAVPCADGTVRLFDIETGWTRRILKGHTDEVYAVVAAPAGDLLATSSKDGTVRIWESTTGRCRVTLVPEARVHPYWGDTLRFAPDGSMLVAVGGGHAGVWGVRSGEHLLAIRGETGVLAAAWSPDSRTLATVGADKRAHLWEVLSGSERMAPLEHPEPLHTVAFHPDGVRLATGGEQITAYLWNCSSGELLASAEMGEPIFGVQRIQQLLFTADGESLLVTSGGFWNVFLRDATTLRGVWRIDFQGGTWAPMTVTLDHAETRVAVSPEPLIVKRDGGARRHLAEDLFGLRFAPRDRYLVAQRTVDSTPSMPAVTSTVVLDGDTLAVIYERTEYPDGAADIRLAR